MERREIIESPFQVQEIVVDETGNTDEETIDDDDYNGNANEGIANVLIRYMYFVAFTLAT